MTATEYITQLIDSQREIHNQLLELAAGQEEALRSSDVEGLNRVVMKQQEAIMKLAQIERERQSIIDQLCSTLCVPTSATLTEMIAALPEPDRSRLGLEARALRTLIGEVQQANRRNQDLISFEKELIDQFVKDVILQAGNVSLPRERRLVDVEA